MDVGIDKGRCKRPGRIVILDLPIVPIPNSHDISPVDGDVCTNRLTTVHVNHCDVFKDDGRFLFLCGDVNQMLFLHLSISLFNVF